MADKELQDFTELTSITTDDILLVVNDPAGTPLSRKITLANLLGGIAGNVVFNEAGANFDFRIEGDTVTDVFGVDAGLDIVSVGTAVRIKERADALADTAAYGQIWVNTATPNELWFTDDAGADTQLTGTRTRNLSLTAHDFAPVSGSPSIGPTHSSNASVWFLDAAADEYIGAFMAVPEDWDSGTVTAKFYYSMAEANTSDDVVLQFSGGSFADGASMATSDFATNNTVTVPDAIHTLDIHTHSAALTVAAGEIMQLRIARLGTDGADTAVGNLQFLSLELEYTGDISG